MPRSVLSLALVVLTVVLSACAGVFGSDAAATVNGHDITMASFNQAFAYRRATTADSLGMDVCAAKSNGGLCSRLKQTVLNDLINEQLVQQYAASHGISVSKADVQRQWALEYSVHFHNNAKVLKTYLKRYHVTLAYLKSLQGQDLLQQRVEYAVTKSMPSAVPGVELSQYRVANQDQLRAARAAVKRGATLVSLSAPQERIKGSLCQTQGCGEIGWIPNSLLPAQEQKAAHARDGTILGPYLTQTSMILVQVEAHTNHLVLNQSQLLNLRQQVFTQWLTHQAQQASIDRHAA